jgi:dipeptidase
MKKRNSSIFKAILLLLTLTASPILTWAGTNIIVGKNASADGSTFCTYTADSYYLYGDLSFYPSATYSKYTQTKIFGWDTHRYQGMIEQTGETYAVLGNINEHQVCITESTFGGRKELIDTTGVLDYGNLIYVTLQRAKTAKEALLVMTELVEEYGYCSSGETFSIADPNEIWIMEMIGKGPDIKGAVWVALKLPDDCISAHSNHSRITTFPLNDRANCLYSKDVISFAREKGYFDGKNKDFSFSDAYDPMSFNARRFCDARVWSIYKSVCKETEKGIDYILGKNDERLPLWVKPDQKVSLLQLKNLQRDHFENSPLSMANDPGAEPFKAEFRYEPRIWEYEGQKYFNETPTAGPKNAFSFVAQMRSWLPNKIGGVLWFGVDDANFTVYIPIYCGTTEVPACFRRGNGSLLKFSWDAAYWVFNWVSNMAYAKYQYLAPDIKNAQAEFEQKLEDNLQVVEEAAQSLYKKSPEYAMRFLTEYSQNQANLMMQQWKALGEHLMVKYTDGNIKRERKGKFIDNGWGVPSDIQTPGYSEEYYKSIVDSTGTRFLLIEE